VSGRSQLALAISSALAGFAWGMLRHRSHSRARGLAMLQSVEWFVAAGGAAWLIENARETLEGAPGPEERITHVRQVTNEHNDGERSARP
jgi:hypothetical protein